MLPYRKGKHKGKEDISALQEKETDEEQDAESRIRVDEDPSPVASKCPTIKSAISSTGIIQPPPVTKVPSSVKSERSPAKGPPEKSYDTYKYRSDSENEWGRRT